LTLYIGQLVQYLFWNIADDCTEMIGCSVHKVYLQDVCEPCKNGWTNGDAIWECIYKVTHRLSSWAWCGCRELHKLDSVTRTPLLSHCVETVAGLRTIRAFRSVDMLLSFSSLVSAWPTDS